MHEDPKSQTVLIDTVGFNDNDGYDVDTLRAIGEGCKDLKVSMFLMVLALGVFDANVRDLVFSSKNIFCPENQNDKFGLVYSKVDVDEPEPAEYKTEVENHRATILKFMK